MGTNYYLSTGTKEKVICNYGCEHEIEENLHIGKSSFGWYFSLHVIPEKNLNELEDWKKILKDGVITNEYGENISYETIIEIILSKDFKLI